MNVKELKDYLEQFDENLQIGAVDEGGCICPTTLDQICVINRFGKDILLITGDYVENFK